MSANVHSALYLLPIGTRVNDRTKERWFRLCQLAAVEQDSEKLMALIREIGSLLEAKETKLSDSRSGQSQKWKEPPESDKHQDIARQPYRSREHGADAASQETSSRSHRKEGD